MNVKQWAVALLFGSLVLGAASCSKDDPNGPKSSVAIKYLEGLWDLGRRSRDARRQRDGRV